MFPSVLGYASGKAFPVGPSAGAVLAARPPAQFFMVAWALLYILLGVAWAVLLADAEVEAEDDAGLGGWFESAEERATFRMALDLGVLALNAMLVAWSAAYVQDKRSALFVLMTTVVALAVGLESLRAFGLWRAAVLLTPLLVWCGYASLLNYSEVNVESAIKSAAGKTV